MKAKEKEMKEEKETERKVRITCDVYGQRETATNSCSTETGSGHQGEAGGEGREGAI